MVDYLSNICLYINSLPLVLAADSFTNSRTLVKSVYQKINFLIS